MSFHHRRNTPLASRLLTGAKDRANELFGRGREGAAPRILLVDDAPVNLAVSCRLLGRLGCRVEPVSTGEYAVALFRDGCHEARYDMVLMDLNMPGMDGLETTRAIRAIETALPDKHPYRVNPVPILALTSKNPGKKLKSFREAGMSDFMYKPFQPEVVKEALMRWLAVPA